ncbi:MAG: hypothetical protein JWL64_734 [Frankiales bacterium]|nr:hypothetical protein [Frankiales bacterium]
MVEPKGWSTPADVTTVVRRKWTSGLLLSSYGRGEPFEPIDVPLRGPRSGQVGEDLERVRRWAGQLEAAAAGRFTLSRRSVGGQAIGRNQLPARAVVTTYAEAWRLLEVTDQVATYDEVLGLVGDDLAVREWVLAHPHLALAVAGDWPGLLAARSWLEAHRGHGRFLREISVPGVDTKFVERHLRTLSSLLGVPSSMEGFLQSLGLRDRPARVRVRFDEEFAGMPRALSEATFRVDELARVRVSVQEVVVVENEVTFLSAPVPAEGLVLFGEGFRVSRLGALPWLRGAEVHYWGDLDTHGFAILDQLRAWLPQTRSFLMDDETLLAHRDRWVSESTPTAAALPRLTASERAVYEALVTDRWGGRVRLEQERVDWEWALERWPC